MPTRVATDAYRITHMHACTDCTYDSHKSHIVVMVTSAPVIRHFLSLSVLLSFSSLSLATRGQPMVVFLSCLYIYIFVNTGCGVMFCAVFDPEGQTVFDH